jgi:hypothetical protein
MGNRSVLCLRCNHCIREYVCCCICDDPATMARKRLTKAKEALERSIKAMDDRHPDHITKIADLTRLTEIVRDRIRNLANNHREAIRQREQKLREMEGARRKGNPIDQTQYEYYMNNPPDGSLIASNMILLAKYASELANVQRENRDADGKLAMMRQQLAELNQMINNSEYRANLAEAAALIGSLNIGSSGMVDIEKLQKRFQRETEPFEIIAKVNRAFNLSLESNRNNRSDKGSLKYDAEAMLNSLLSDIDIPKEYRVLAQSELSRVEALAEREAADEKKTKQQQQKTRPAAPKREEMESALLPPVSEREEDDEAKSQFSVTDQADAVDGDEEDVVELSVTEVRRSEEKEVEADNDVPHVVATM